MQKGLGATAIAPLLGLSPFSDEHDVWLEIVKGISKEQTPAMSRGIYLEDGIGQWFNSMQLDPRGQPKYHLRRWPNATAVYEPWPVARCRPDFVLIETDYDDEQIPLSPCPLVRKHMLRLLEIKTSSPKQRPKWNNIKKPDLAPPEHYRVQCLWQLGVTGIDVADLTAHVGDDVLYTFEIEADPEWFASVLDYAKDWWQIHVIEGKEPI